MVLNRLKWTYRAWRYRQRLERQEIRLLLRHLAPGDVAVDVGAHKGAYTYWMRRAVGVSGRVYAFEPQPALADGLRALVSGSGFDNVVVENLGLSSAAGTLTLNVPGSGPSPGASFEPGHGIGRDAGCSYPVAVTTLDAYFQGADGGADQKADQNADRGRIRLLKCDAEGHELEVFRGGRELLREVRPCLLFECEQRHRGGGSVEEVFRWLEALGYRGYFVDRNGPRDIAEFDPRLHQANHAARNYVNNFLFLPAAAARRAPAA
jgi:FkbM family methyltransferase